MDNPKLKYGLIFGGIWSAIYILFYLIKPEVNFQIAIPTVLSIILPVIFMPRAIKEVREREEGMISFGEAFLTSGTVFFIGNLIFSVTMGLLLMDFDYRALGEQMTLDTAVGAMESMFGMMNAPEEARTEALAEIMANPPQLAPLNTAMMSFFGGLVFPGIIIALIASAIMKKN